MSFVCICIHFVYETAYFTPDVFDKMHGNTLFGNVAVSNGDIIVKVTVAIHGIAPTNMANTLSSTCYAVQRQTHCNSRP